MKCPSQTSVKQKKSCETKKKLKHANVTNHKRGVCNLTQQTIQWNQRPPLKYPNWSETWSTDLGPPSAIVTAVDR